MEKRCSGKEGDPHSPVIRVFHFLRRERLRERDFPIYQMLQAREPTSFLRENVIAVVILIRVLAKIS